MKVFDKHPLKGKKVLVTGGCGFIGSHLCDALTECGSQVVCLDNLSAGKLENVEHLRGNSTFEFLQKRCEES